MLAAAPHAGDRRRAPGRGDTQEPGGDRAAPGRALPQGGRRGVGRADAIDAAVDLRRPRGPRGPLTAPQSVPTAGIRRCRAAPSRPRHPALRRSLRRPVHPQPRGRRALPLPAGPARPPGEAQRPRRGLRPRGEGADREAGARPVRGVRAPRRGGRRADPGSRHVAADVKRAVWKRDDGQCTYESESGRRCEARGNLQFDHVKEFARGGEATVDEPPAALPGPQPAHRRADVRRRLHEARSGTKRGRPRRGSVPSATRRRPPQPAGGPSVRSRPRSHDCCRTSSRSSRGCGSSVAARTSRGSPPGAAGTWRTPRSRTA